MCVYVCACFNNVPHKINVCIYIFYKFYDHCVQYLFQLTHFNIENISEFEVIWWNLACITFTSTNLNEKN